MSLLLLTRQAGLAAGFGVFCRWTISVKICNDWGKLNLAFDLEVCKLLKSNVICVRRKRVKGDSWHYKKYCDDILASVMQKPLQPSL